MGGLSLELFLHLLQDVMKFADINGPVKTVKDLHKTTHMGPLEVMGKIHIHIDGGNGVLFGASLIKYSYRIGDGLHPHLLDIDTAMILLVLDIFHNGNE